MSVPTAVRKRARTVAEYVGGLKARLVHPLTKEEADLGVHLRGNAALYETLTEFLKSRIEGRARLPEPTDPLVCKSILARDGEIRFLLGRLNSIYHAPVKAPADTSEQPQ